jgi:hypothetical protein
MDVCGGADGFRGRYFVLKGHLSPLDGLGPEAIGIPQLMARIEEAAPLPKSSSPPTRRWKVKRLRITSPALANKGLIASRIAHGVPLGGELELVDGGRWRIRLPGVSRFPLKVYRPTGSCWQASSHSDFGRSQMLCTLKL